VDVTDGDACRLIASAREADRSRASTIESLSTWEVLLFDVLRAENGGEHSGRALGAAVQFGQ
jgi:hypothetical protein